MALTNTTVKQTQPVVKPQKLFDDGGLYLCVTPEGGKYWRLKYRFGGSEMKLALGVYPEVMLETARERRGPSPTR
ncbi:Arm DNA-binding domain-containing protein [Paraburkholderia bannensis]|uniref:Arm DNA-binding domain-containing protein n=1 Tax=Paraburkholderia bannensis TaxID=765414 RepID=UPI002AB641C5|nr:Arm DNA-binding domain-containing protein [Paraburkholderia bannensis]